MFIFRYLAAGGGFCFSVSACCFSIRDWFQRGHEFYPFQGKTDSYLVKWILGIRKTN